MTRTKSSKPRLRLRIACSRPTKMVNPSKGYLPKWSWEITIQQRFHKTILKNPAWKSKSKLLHSFCKNRETWVSNRANPKTCSDKIMAKLRAIITPKNLILAPAPNQSSWNNRRSLSSKIQTPNITRQTRSTSLRPKAILNSHSNSRALASISWELVQESETSRKAMLRASKTNSKAHPTADKPREVLQEEANRNHQLVSHIKTWTRSPSITKGVNSSKTRAPCSNRRVRTNWPRTEDSSWLSNSRLNTWGWNKSK